MKRARHIVGRDHDKGYVTPFHSLTKENKMKTPTKRIARRLRILPDQVGNPRIEYDTIGRMLCWHRRYNFGDEHQYDPNDWKRELACEFNDELEEKIISIENDSYDIWYDEAKQKRYDDPHAYAIEKVEDAVNRLIDRAFDASYVALPLYLYDHSGLALNVSRFTCPWDSCCIGVIVCDQSTIDKEFNGDRERAKKSLEAEVRDYDAYISGNVYYYLAESAEYTDEDGEPDETDWTVEDSCGGFYGPDPRTNGIADHVPDAWSDCIDHAIYD